MQSFHVKITQAGWETFNGDFAGYMFENGLSTHALPRNICDRIAALVGTEILDGDENLGQGGAAARIASRRSLEATVGTALERQSEEDKAAENVTVLAEAGKAPVREFFTEEQLFSIGELEGIEGVRKIATPWNLKHRSIPGLIQLIVKAQNNFVQAKEQRENDERFARAAALDDAFAKREAEEAEAMKAARVLTTDETPNAIGPDGKSIHVEIKGQG